MTFARGGDGVVKYEELGYAPEAATAAAATLLDTPLPTGTLLLLALPFELDNGK